MGWVNDDGGHEGYLTPVFADGVEGGGSTTTGIIVGYDHESNVVVRPDAEVTSWRLQCDHYPGGDSWQGSSWTRVSARAEEDLAARRLYCADEDVAWVTDTREDLSQLVMGEWRAHVAPADAIQQVRKAVGAAAAAQQQLQQAVVAAKLAGASWGAIGAAAGTSRQAAHERWAGHIPATKT